jgi:hypothetical protein
MDLKLSTGEATNPNANCKYIALPEKQYTEIRLYNNDQGQWIGIQFHCHEERHVYGNTSADYTSYLLNKGERLVGIKRLRSGRKGLGLICLASAIIA